MDAPQLERLRHILRQQADDIRRIADHLVPPPPPVVGTRYVAHKLGTTTQWIGQMISEGKIPKSCVLQGTGDGRQWKLHREEIDAWLDGR